MEPSIYKPSIYNGAGIYKTGSEGGGGGGGGGDLPEGYTPAIYAASNGGVCLEFTGLNINYNDTYLMQFSLQDLSGDLRSGGFCSITSNKSMSSDFLTQEGDFFTPRYIYNNNIYSPGWWCDYQNSGDLITQKAYKNKLDVSCISKGYSRTLTIGSVAEDAAIVKLQMFDRYVNGQTTTFKGRIYSLKVYDKDNPNKLNADFVPCRDENNVLGFYEKISGQFKGNANLVE